MEEKPCQEKRRFSMVFISHSHHDTKTGARLNRLILFLNNNVVYINPIFKNYIRKNLFKVSALTFSKNLTTSQIATKCCVVKKSQSYRIAHRCLVILFFVLFFIETFSVVVNCLPIVIILSPEISIIPL
jgi:hypothetical protein